MKNRKWLKRTEALSECKELRFNYDWWPLSDQRETRRERLKSALYLRLKKRETFFLK